MSKSPIKEIATPIIWDLNSLIPSVNSKIQLIKNTFIIKSTYFYPKKYDILKYNNKLYAIMSINKYKNQLEIITQEEKNE